jgi:hypothetical protein
MNSEARQLKETASPDAKDFRTCKNLNEKKSKTIKHNQQTGFANGHPLNY